MLGHHLYSLASFVMRVSNYQAMMGAYNRQLWNKILPILQTAPEEVRTSAFNTHLEATTLAKQQPLAARHTADANSNLWLLLSPLDGMLGYGLQESMTILGPISRIYPLMTWAFSMKRLTN